MRNERQGSQIESRHYRGESRLHSEHKRERGAKTFRRGRAISFLQKMNMRRARLKQQLETPELQTIHPILVGELKAIETVIDEFIQVFELYEMDVIDEQNQSLESLEHNDEDDNKTS